jgi:Kelch motif
MAGTWQPLVNTPPFSASTMLLQTDGSVMCHVYFSRDWWKLTPDASGSYIKGSWTKLASMAHSRLYYASAVLNDGRVFVAGGEYSDAGGDTNDVEIYDPYLDSWTTIAGPGWAGIGDAVSCVLADGKVLLGSIVDKKTAIYDPETDSWSAGGTKDDASSEETWTLLPDGTVLTVECSNIPKAEKYLPATNKWIAAGSTPVPIAEASMSEIGPALLLPNGRVFCVGGTGHTALYRRPAHPSQPGSWTQGPDFPDNPPGQIMKANDAPGCLMPNGKVLLAAGPAPAYGFASPTYFFEYNPATNTMSPAPAPANAGGVVYQGRMLLLPSGQVLFAAGTADIEVYTPSGGPKKAWRPQITAHPHKLRAGQSYSLHGRGFNGLSQAVSYGDDAQMATNYPLVKLVNEATGHVQYCPTYDHSTMAVATRNKIVSTNFMVPFDIELGDADLCVVANGISSPCIDVEVKSAVPDHFGHYEAWSWLIGSLADGPLWAIGPHGPIPVDPFKRLLAKRARAAYADLRQGVRELQSVGKEVARLRSKSPSPKVAAKPSREARRSARPRATSTGRRKAK